jgi:hypothetical protein
LHLMHTWEGDERSEMLEVDKRTSNGGAQGEKSDTGCNVGHSTFTMVRSIENS